MPEPLLLDRDVYLELVAHCYDGLPFEACGLVAAEQPSGRVVGCYPTENEAASARLYTVPSKALLRADRDAEARGLVLAGVFHSHTHTTAYPSPTDVAQAPDPTWHYVIVGLGEGAPVVRSYRIVEGVVEEEPVVLLGPGGPTDGTRECRSEGGVSIPE
jgi:proteasome lid subunit RPN8/RPN11